MNTEYFDEFEDYFDFSSQFEELEKEDNLTRKLAENKRVHYDVIKIEKEDNHNLGEKEILGEIQEEGEWEDEMIKDPKQGDQKTGKRYRLYK